MLNLSAWPANAITTLWSLLGADVEPLDEDEVQRLVQLARSGDRVASQRIYRQYVGRVFRTVRGMLYSDADAEDVTQDALFTVLSSLHRYSPRSGTRFVAWVIAIAVNTARRRFRRHQPEFKDPSELPDLPDDKADPQGEAEMAQQHDALVQALSELDQRERDIVCLRYGAELTATEIAELVHLESANVRKIIERTRVRLRARIECILDHQGAES